QHSVAWHGISNFPFSTQNRHRLLALFMVFCGSGFSIPFLMVRHHLKK
ncbi:hypothetical protein X777_03277, partial [Ooceraea biroi]